jgi:hypothetical protein
MRATFKLFLPYFCCLSLFLLAGCGGKDGATNSAASPPVDNAPVIGNEQIPTTNDESTSPASNERISTTNGESTAPASNGQIPTTNNTPDNISSTLVGKWELDNAERLPQGVILPYSNEFFQDGTGIGFYDVLGDQISLDFSWRADNNHIRITASGQTYTWNYTVSGSTLTLTNDSGTRATYKKTAL